MVEGSNPSRLTSSAAVDAHPVALAAPQRAMMERIRAVARAAAPTAQEGIAYQMPALRLHGRFLVSYGAFTRHCSLFPASDAVVRSLGDEIAPYLAGKGTIRFPISADLPAALVARVVEVRLAEVAGSSRATR